MAAVFLAYLINTEGSARCNEYYNKISGPSPVSDEPFPSYVSEVKGRLNYD
jgi:hypothetical protein